MYTLLSILVIIACLLLILVVLIQNPKGGGISANFSAPTQIMGAKKSSDFIEKATWGLAIALIVFSLSSNFLRPSEGTDSDVPESRLGGQIENIQTPAPAVTPAPEQAPEQAPAPEQAQPTPAPAN
ncbi:MAG: preprotein translocase subunit SecG [Bacteroidia bacterium]|nr:preprotein translocase subunit SecG [Bacteroidia bacterium]MCZ2140847.1 preprotein translocase subunit SecG [Bacteroidia bacterium]